MSTKLDLGKIFFLILFLTLSVMTVMAGTIKGSITDKQTREPLTGATVQIVGTTQGAIADMDGNYSLNVTNGIYTLSIKYVGYRDIVVNNVKSGKTDVVLNFELESDAQALGEVSVVARKNLEGERALQMERRELYLLPEFISITGLHGGIRQNHLRTIWHAANTCFDADISLQMYFIMKEILFPVSYPRRI